MSFKPRIYFVRENNVIILCLRAVASIRWVELPVSCSYTGTWDRPESRDLRTRRLVHGTSGAPRDSWAAVLASPQSNNPWTLWRSSPLA